MSHAAAYRAALKRVVAASAAPYGYTLTIWTSGAVLAHDRDIPSAPEALAFMAGAVAAFGGVGWLAHGARGRLEQGPAPSLWRMLHFGAVAVAILLAWAVASHAPEVFAWPLGGFGATAAYLLVVGVQLMLEPGRLRGRR